MKRKYFFALSLCTALSLSAQSSLDLISKAQLRNLRLEQKHRNDDGFESKVRKLKSMIGVPESHTLAIVKLAPGATDEDLRKEGVNVMRSRYGFAFVSMSLDDVERVSSLKSVLRLQLARPVKQNMNSARKATGVDKIHQGLDLPHAYTGKGVISGIFDGGFDPNHINFRDENGKSRFGYFAQIRVNQNATSEDDLLIQKFYDRDNISKFKTDDETNFHGTHTLGIMAGGYRGEANVATINADSTVTVSKVANPFYGVAYESDIAAACGDMMDMIIAYGVDYILQYAKSENKRCVINLSLGIAIGPHDGKSVLCQFFDECVKQENAIICLATGNSGDQKVALNKTFNADDKEMKTFISGFDTDFESGKAYARYGNTAIYSNDDKPFEIQAVMFNKSRGQIAGRYSFTISDETKGTGKYWISSSEYQQSTSDIIDRNFGKWFDGYIGIGWDIDPDSNRFYAIVDYMAINKTANKENNYEIGFIVTGKEGQRVDAFCDGNYSALSNAGVEGWDDGIYDGSLSDTSTGYKTLSVGSFNSASACAKLDGHLYSSSLSMPVGGISNFSSFGTLSDGRSMPDVCAPGSTIISSTNSYYVAANKWSESEFMASKKEADRENYWDAASGTSMAAPHVSGAIALWLEADPTLTIDDVKEIVSKTAIKDEYVLAADKAKAGAGKFDAYEGLKEVLRRTSGINGIEGNSDRLVVTAVGDRTFKAFLAGAEKLDAVVYDIAGRPVLHTSSTGDELTIDVSALSMGVYVFNVNGRYSLRVLVK